MNAPCNVILDLLPLVKDNVASEDSMNLVLEHLKNCERCMLEYESCVAPKQKEMDDRVVLSSIKKKLFLITSALLVLGAFIGIALQGSASSAYTLSIVSIVGAGVAGILILKSDSKGDNHMRKFFAGRAIGTIIIFAILGIYLLLKYVLHLF